jgi:hypothetical protein
MILVLLVLASTLLLPSSAHAIGEAGISGLVSAPVEGVAEVEVCIVELLPTETCTYPHANGEYELLNLNPGIYQVVFLPSYRSHLVAQYYNRKLKLENANRVTVIANQVTPHINAELELGGEIEGRVTTSLGAQGLGEVEVCAQDSATSIPVGCTHTDAAGNYALPSIPPGPYRVGFWGQGQSAAYAAQYYDERTSFIDGTSIPVNAGETVSGIDADLKVGAQISGTVTDSATASPLGEIAVCLLKLSAIGPERCAYTELDGRYTFGGLSSGSYQVIFSPEFSEFSSGDFVLPDGDGWQTQYFAGSEIRAGSTILNLTAPQQRVGVDATLVTSFVPPPPTPSPPVHSTAIPLPPVANEPSEPKKAKLCRKGKRKRKIKGKVRCVAVHKRHPTHHRGHRRTRS